MTDNRLCRESCLKSNQAPTISVIKCFMKPALADVYFKSMNQKLKKLAGLEPPLKGGGGFWHVPPKDLLQGRAVLKPLNSKSLKRLGWHEIDDIAKNMMANYNDQMKSEIDQEVRNKDEEWKQVVTKECKKYWQKCAAAESKALSDYIRTAFSDFTLLYVTSLTKLEQVIANSAVQKIKDTRCKARREMEIKYEDLLQKQAMHVTQKYTLKLSEEKEKLKANFVEEVEKRRAASFEKVHDVKLETRLVIEQLRHFLECQKTACQVYVALKEQEECSKENDLTKNRQGKEKKKLDKKIKANDLYVGRTKVRDKKQDEFMKQWRNKVSQVYKHFQTFVLYCLKTMPEQAEYFINMEKILLMQLTEALKDPNVDSIFEPDPERYSALEPNPRPFYLFCEKTNKPHIRKDLCPNHCTSSAPQFPVVVINKRCIYSQCDNFGQFSDKIKGCVYDALNEDKIEDYNYDFAVPVKCSSSRLLQEFKLESSIMQVLEHEISNIQNKYFVCTVCKVPHCYCYHNFPHSHNTEPSQKKPLIISYTVESKSSIFVSRQEELNYRRNSIEDYFSFVHPKQCVCPKMVKKHLREQLPTYMRINTNYDATEFLNYKPCSALEIKKLVKTAKENVSLPKVHKGNVAAKPKTKEVACQYVDLEYSHVCSCFSNDKINNICSMDYVPSSELSFDCNLLKVPSDSSRGFKVVGDSQPSSCLLRSSQSFVEARILSLRRLMQSSEVQ